jgi:hypothetical protein
VARKFRLSNRILNPAGRGSELPMEYLWDLYSVRITIETAGCDNPPRKIPYYRLRLIHFGH